MSNMYGIGGMFYSGAGEYRGNSEGSENEAQHIQYPPVLVLQKSDQGKNSAVV